MIIVTCDNSRDRGQVLRTMRPAFAVDIRTLQPKERWNHFYRNDSINDLIGCHHLTFDLSKGASPEGVVQELEGMRAFVIDHEALARCFADFWEDAKLGAKVALWLRSGGILWIGFQSEGYLPGWLSSLLGSNSWSVKEPGVADSIQVASGEVHPLIEGFPRGRRIDWICNDTYRALKSVITCDTIDFSPQPSERGSLAWLETSGEGWRVLAHRFGKPEQTALALRAVDKGQLVLDQTLALYGPNIDNFLARRFAANMRSFLGKGPLRKKSSRRREGYFELLVPEAPEQGARKIIRISGVPFARYGDENLLAFDGERTRIKCGFRAERLIFLGNIFSWQMATGAWFIRANDFSQDLFIGDEVGKMILRYSDGTDDEVPLIIGWNIFWAPRHLALGGGLDHPFDDPAAKAILDDALALSSGGKEDSAAWLLELFPKRKRIEQISFVKSKKKFGIPVYCAITVLAEKPSPALRFLSPAEHPPSRGKGIRLPARVPRKKLRRLQRLLYTFPEDFLKAPLDAPGDFEGAKIHFRGARHAEALNCIYASSISNLSERIHPKEGVVSLSLGLNYGNYRSCIGTWFIRKRNPYRLNAWGRDNGRAGIERTALGLCKLAEKEVRYFDRHLYCGEPPHLERTTGHIKQVSEWEAISLAGNRIRVAPENDGHGLVMLYRSIYQRHHPEEIEALWPQTVDWAEWICFAMENPLEKNQPPDTLYTVSECSGFGNWDICSNYLCYAALRTAVDIAWWKGKEGKASRWQGYAERLEAAMMKSLVVREEDFHRWYYSPFSEWQSFMEGLAPLTALPDYRTYDVAETDGGFLEVSRSTYEMLLRGEKWWLRTRMVGYDQALALQAALLLDDGPRVERLLAPLLRACYSRQGGNPWVVAEGAVIHETEKMWHKLGMSGNLIHIAETLKVVRLMVGIDDLSQGKIKVMPRIPARWKGISVSEYPISAWCAGKRAIAGYDYELDRSGARLRLDLSEEVPADVRLGPFPSARLRASADGRDVPVETFSSASGYWAWVRNLRGRHIAVTVRCK